MFGATDVSWQQQANVDVHIAFSQQEEGATCHTTRETIALLYFSEGIFRGMEIPTFHQGGAFPLDLYLYICVNLPDNENKPRTTRVKLNQADENI